jgi:hypothetical protein
MTAKVAVYFLVFSFQQDTLGGNAGERLNNPN